MASNKKKLIKTILTSKPCNCKTKDVHEPEPKGPKPTPTPKPNPQTKPNQAAASEDVAPATTSHEAPKPDAGPEPGVRYASQSLLRRSSVRNSIAVAKESEDPYSDFKDSMLQMVREREMYSKEDLQGLLHCFLSLNNPCHQDDILRAFLEIWDDVSCGGWVDQCSRH